MTLASPSDLVSKLDTCLVELGLSTSERELYLLSYKLGPTSITDLSEKIGLKRPYVYTLIQALREKGLVDPDTTKYRRSFVVRSPSVVLGLLRKQRARLESLSSSMAADMPAYLSGYRQGGERTQVLFYEGREKFFELYDRVLEEEGKETLYYGEAERFLTIVQPHLKDWISQRIQKKVKIRSLMTDSLRARSIPSDEIALRETRIFYDCTPDDVPAAFQVFGKSVIFWQPMTPVGVVLQDEYIAQLMRDVFERLWQQAKSI